MSPSGDPLPLRPTRMPSDDGSQILLHMSGVIAPGGALLFSGPSGAGKSTIAALLSRHYPLLSDDAVCVARDPASGVWRVKCLGACPRGTSPGPAGELGTVPVLAVMRLHKAEHPALTPSGPCESFGWLVASLFEIAGQSMRYATLKGVLWVRQVADLARNVGTWHLHFTKDNDTVAVINRYLKEGG